MHAWMHVWQRLRATLRHGIPVECHQILISLKRCCILHYGSKLVTTLVVICGAFVKSWGILDDWLDPLWFGLVLKSTTSYSSQSACLLVNGPRRICWCSVIEGRSWRIVTESSLISDLPDMKYVHCTYMTSEICFTLYAARMQRYTINSGGCVYRSIKTADFFSFVHINGLGLLCSEQNGGKFSFVRRTKQAKLSLKYHLQKHENS